MNLILPQRGRLTTTGAGIEFIAAADALVIESASGAVTCAKPIGTQEGDLMIAMTRGTKGTGSWTQPSGWVEVRDASSVSVSYKIAGASEPSNYTFTWAAEDKNVGAAIITLRNAVYSAVGTVSTSLTASAVTVAASGSTLVGFCSGDNKDNTNTTQAEMTRASHRPAGGDNEIHFASFYQAEVAAGSSGTRVFVTSPSSAGEAASVLVAVAP